MKNCELTPLVCDICFFPPHLLLFSVKLHYSYTLDINANQLHWRTEEDVQVSAKITANLPCNHLSWSLGSLYRFSGKDMGIGALHDITKSRITELCALAHAYTLKNGA